MERELALIKTAIDMLRLSGAILTLCGPLAVYVFIRHQRENDDCKRENREDHKIIFAKIDGKRK